MSHKWEPLHLHLASGKDSVQRKATIQYIDRQTDKYIDRQINKWDWIEPVRLTSKKHESWMIFYFLSIERKGESDLPIRKSTSKLSRDWDKFLDPSFIAYFTWIYFLGGDIINLLWLNHMLQWQNYVHAVVEKVLELTYLFWALGLSQTNKRNIIIVEHDWEQQLMQLIKSHFQTFIKNIKYKCTSEKNCLMAHDAICRPSIQSYKNAYNLNSCRRRFLC